jgi:hypothetical protein
VSFEVLLLESGQGVFMHPAYPTHLTQLRCSKSLPRVALSRSTRIWRFLCCQSISSRRLLVAPPDRRYASSS